MDHPIPPNLVTPLGEWLPFFEESDRKDFCGELHLSPAQMALLESDVGDSVIDLGELQPCTIECARNMPPGPLPVAVSSGRADVWVEIGWDVATATYFAQMWDWQEAWDGDPRWYAYIIDTLEDLEMRLGFALAKNVKAVLRDAAASTS